MAYDVIIVGARVAGATTALLLASEGLRVLLVDRAVFPSDTLSSHQLQPPGAERLARWGLLDEIVAAGTPATRKVRFDNNGVILHGNFPDEAALYSPRRTVLDRILVDSARMAGAEVHERTIVEQVIRSGNRVTGIRCREKGSRPVTAKATLVVGADGKHSLVADKCGARTYRRREPRSLAFYTYWQDVPLDCGELVARDRRIVGAWPTNDGLTITYIAWPASEFETFRADPLRNVRDTLNETGRLGDRIRAGKHVGPLRGTIDLPNVFRRPYGRGWALAGDAGLVMDSITGQGIGHALRDADLLSAAIIAGLGGTTSLGKALAQYAKVRDAETKPMYDLTVRLASFAPPSEADQMLFSAIAERPEYTEEFFGVLAGSVPVNRLFAPRRLIDLVGVRGFAQLARGQLRRPQPRD
jgi:flavin-dependent dehydrogenase